MLGKGCESSTRMGKVSEGCPVSCFRLSCCRKEPAEPSRVGSICSVRTWLSQEKEMTDLAANVFQVRTSTKKAPASRSRRAPSTRVKRMSKRSSKSSFITPATGRNLDLCARGGASIVTPRFDSRVFKTPGLRTPAVNERVYTVSANGSPLADGNDVFITIPVGGGESVRLTASDLTKKNLLHLNPE
uniref:Borealin C-terminal domain-containing protein n=1 Tax=Phasianus colchicus TaxID=9054 RepID=A0A669QTZ6_PHACC